MKPNQENLKWKHWDFLISLKSLENHSHTSWSRGQRNYPRKKCGKSWSGAGFWTDTAERITVEVTAVFSFSHHVAKEDVPIWTGHIVQYFRKKILKSIS